MIDSSAVPKHKEETPGIVSSPDPIKRFGPPQERIDKETVLGCLNFRTYFELELGDIGPAAGGGWTKNRLCPFHEEKTGSFGVNINTGQFKCFGCGVKGDIFEFQQKRHSQTFSEAIKALAYFAGVTASTPFNKQDHKLKKKPKQNDQAQRLWDSLKAGYNSSAVYNLLVHRRKINNDFIMDRFFNGVLRSICHKGREAVAVPFTSLEGKVLAVQCLSVNQTAFDGPSKANKVFTGGSYAGRECFFQCGAEIYAADTIALTESVIDALSGAECLPDVCWLALGGSTYFKKTAALKPYADQEKKIVCFFDNDDAGEKAVKNVVKALGEKTLSVVWPEGSPAGHDVNGILKDEYHQMVIDMVDGAVPCRKETERKKIFPPQGPESTSFKKNVITCPPSREFILTCNGVGLLPKGVVGVITATGGVGKTFFLFSLGVTLASGGRFGPIEAAEPQKTLIVCGEDDQDEMNRRLWNITGGAFPDILYGTSTVGEVGPLMELNGNKPIRAAGFTWLEETIRLYPGLNVLILDPKSRFYGLDENNNDHATQWIQCLEYLSKEYGINILFAHHTSKQDGGRISQNMSRGAGSIVDGSRWQAGMIRMDQETADRHGIHNPRAYVAFDVPKNNYSPDMDGRIYFKRNGFGVLEYVDFKQGRLETLGKILFELLVDDSKRYTCSELIKAPAGKNIAMVMKTTYSSFARSKDMELVIQWLIDKGFLKRELSNPGRHAKEVLVPLIVEKS